MHKKKKNMNVGAAILFVFFGLLFFVLGGRFLYIQITGEAEGEVLAAKAMEKTLKSKAIESKRGKIVDRNGSIIAEDTSSYTLAAILDEEYTVDASKPRHVVDPEKTAKKLAEHIEMEEEEILNRLQNEKAFQVEFGAAGRDISHTVKKEIEELNLPGIIFTRDSKRFYPNGIFASHVVGYAEKQQDKDTKKVETEGKLGIEKTLNDELKGTHGILNYESDRWGYLLPNKKEKITPPKDGNNVKLTLDKKIQTFMEDSLNKVQKEYKPKKLIAIVSNPKTGEIYAMSQRPTFNPTNKEGLEDTWKNLAVEEYFEPGSTMKVFTLAAAVEEGTFNPNAYFKSEPYKIKGSRDIQDHRGIRGKTMTYLEAVERSSNVGFVRIALEQLGEDKFRQYLTDFGFEKPTGIDLPNEVGGKILYKAQNEKATTAFGQGSVITPIQQIQAFSAIASNGEMKKPYVIDEISEANGKVVKKTEPSSAGKPISEETAKEVRGYLEHVISGKNGTGKKYAIDGYSVAGKTGTAQIPGPNGGYLTGSNDYYYSFIGMAPAENPQLTMYVAILQPEMPAGKTASDALSSIFKPVMKNSLNYLNIKPSNMSKKEVIGIEDYEGKNVTEAQSELQDLGYEVIVLGEGNTIEEQVPVRDSVLIQGEKVILKTSGEMKMPDLTGWSLRDVMKLTNMARLELNSSGNGYVTKQNIKVGQPITEGEYFIVELQSPDPTKKNEVKKDKKEVHD